MLNTFPNTSTLFSTSTTNYWMNKITGSCNGLVLLVCEPKKWLFDNQRCTDIGTRMLVINVTTLENVELPNNPLEFDPYENLDGFCLHGFGINCLNDDCKIVTLASYPSPSW
ncbi:hypothetical protein ACH5RR_033480 [Cinchona calisaya]|uniref:Uncharacterized protein n=1 Tax=Cinchona calisaya TaxID=153742 RepID=A0ABD2YRD2_9GENT